ncbi:MAG: 16S rRNA (cytidine(1402)-2'-O)-methyltransferase [Patescibacteria group bacterium]
MLSIVATPIGNLGDITLRAIETLKQCDAIVCEDTRVTGNLLKQLDIAACHGEPRRTMARVFPLDGARGDTPRKPLLSFHGHSDPGTVEHILNLLKAGKHLALVSDAGTPGISDPGYAIVKRAREAGVKIEAVPGPSAFLAALSVSGLPINHFVYLGFLPLKKGRKTLLDSFKEEEKTIVFYESVHRIGKTLTELADALKDQPERPVAIARELTKLHEEVVHTNVSSIPQVLPRLTQKGEFVVIIGAR